jgi:glycosyltransferase involved in cell wall biosynthesis
MRILMLTDLYPPIVGGIEQHVRNLSRALVARQHQVAVVTLWHEGLARQEWDEGVRVYRVRGTTERLEGLFSDRQRRYAPPFPDPQVLAALRRILARERPAIVHAHNWMVHSFLPLKRRSGPRLVVTLHDYSLNCPKKDLLYQDTVPCSGPGFPKCLSCAAHHYSPVKGTPIVFSSWLMNGIERLGADRFLPVSQAVAQGNGLVGSRLPYEVIPNFVPDDVGVLTDDSSAWMDLLPPGPFMLFVGALGRHKGLSVLLDAYQRLEAPPPLVLIGADWPDTPATFPPNVIVGKNWPHQAVMHAWQRCLFGLAPSIWGEPCPTVVMEAMAMGRPVIGTEMGGLPDLIAAEHTGLLVPPQDPDALAQAMATLLADSATRARMGRAAQEKVREFLASTVVGRIEQVYQTLAAG